MGEYITPEDYSLAVQRMGLKGAQDWVRKNNITIVNSASGGALPSQETQMEDDGELPPVGGDETDTESTLSVAPSAGGLTSLDAVNAAQKIVTDRIKANINLFTDAQRRLRERRVGPSNAEKWLAIAAALGKPTRTGSFGESLGNLNEALLGDQAARRKAEEERDMLLEQYGLKVGTEELRLAQANAAQAAQAYRAQLAANKPQWARTEDPVTGEITLTPVYANSQQASSDIDPADLKTLFTNPTKLPLPRLIELFNGRYGAGRAEKLLGVK